MLGKKTKVGFWGSCGEALKILDHCRQDFPRALGSTGPKSCRTVAEQACERKRRAKVKLVGGDEAFEEMR